VSRTQWMVFVLWFVVGSVMLESEVWCSCSGVRKVVVIVGGVGVISSGSSAASLASSTLGCSIGGGLLGV